MPKLHWISMALIAAPAALILHCSGDDTTPAGGTTGAGGSTTSAGGSGGAAGASGVATTGGGAGATGGTAGTGGRGTGGSAGSGGTGGKADGGGTGGAAPDGGALDVNLPDVITDAVGGNTMACTDPNGYMDGGGVGTTCVQYCQAYFDVCNANPAVAADAGMGFYMNQGDCVNKCRAFLQTQICCYVVHVNNASLMDAAGAAVHCKHAAGLPMNGACPDHP